MPMPNNGPDSEVDPSRVFLDALRRFVALAVLCPLGRPREAPLRFPWNTINELLIDSRTSLMDAFNALDWRPEEDARTPEEIAIDWACHILDDIMVRLSRTTREISDGYILSLFLFARKGPDRLLALKLALNLADITPGKPSREAELTRL